MSIARGSGKACTGRSFLADDCDPNSLWVLQPGALQQSENGVENSEKFYKLIRPYEGMARTQLPSAVTQSGYKFTTYTDRV